MMRLSNFALKFSLNLATLVPEKREEVTTESGLDVIAHQTRVATTCKRLYDAGIEEVALFVDPEIDQLDATAETGANCIELHTGEYAIAKSLSEKKRQLERLAAAATHAHNLGLRIHAGHGLDYKNYSAFRKTVPHVAEVSIGFAIVAKAVLVGFERAVKEMLEVVKG